MNSSNSNVRVRAAALVLKDDKLLVIKDPSRGCFQLPGGKVEHGESLEEALKREVKEEINCSVKSARFDGAFVSEPDEKGIRHCTVAYLTELNEVPNPTGGIAEVAWLDLGKSFELKLSDSTKFFAERFAKGIRFMSWLQETRKKAAMPHDQIIYGDKLYEEGFR